ALIVRASIGVGFIVMAEATLSFLGIGVQEPLPTWGGMIRDGLVALRTEPYLALSASAALGVTIVGFNLLGDGLRDILDPKIRGRSPISSRSSTYPPRSPRPPPPRP